MSAAHDLDTLKRLLTVLESRGIRILLEGEQLRLQAPKGAVNHDLQEQIKAHKTLLLKHLLSLEKLPLTPIQKRLWFLQQLEPLSARYHEAVVLRFVVGKGPISEFRQKLERAWQQIMFRHQALRAQFCKDQTGLWQSIAADTQLSVATGLGSEAQIQSFIQQPFDLTQAPLVRIGVFAAPDREPDQVPAYLLVGVFHHLITDAWSAGIVLHDLLRALNHDVLSEQSLSYRQYLLAQPPEGQKNSPLTRSEQTPLWPEIPRVLALPGALNQEHSLGRVVVPDAAASIRLGLRPELEPLISDFCTQAGVTRMTVLLSAWQSFLALYWQLPNFLMATPITGRRAQAEESLVGCLIDTLLLPVQIDPEAAFLQQVQQNQQSMFLRLDQFRTNISDSDTEHELDFEALIQRLNPPRELPFFPQLCFVYQDFILELPKLQGSPLSWQRAPFQPAKFELLCSWIGYTQEFMLEWPQGWFQAEVMQRLLEHFLYFLDQALRHPERPLKTLALYPKAYQNQLLHFVPNSRPLEGPTTLASAVSEIARIQPEAVALVMGSSSKSYAELEIQASQMARALQQFGVVRGERVAVWCQISPEIPALLLAIVKLGATYVPLDEDLPLHRLQQILADAQPCCLIWQREDHSSLNEPLTTQAKSLAELLLLAQQEGVVPLESLAEPEDIAYIIYTSGSTGQPNGVPIQHKQVCRLFAATALEFDFLSQDHWLLFHSLAFDFSVWELWGAFYFGACLHLLPRAELKNPERVWDYLCEARITIFNQTPSAFRILNTARERNPQNHALRLLLLSGEKLDFRHLKPWYDLESQGPASQCLLVNAYGITETTVLVTWLALKASDAQRSDSPIGKPLSDMGLLLLDKQGKPVPEGVPGEICVLGAGLSRGYLQRAELTRQRFMRYDFEHLGFQSAGPSAQSLYRSGDLAYWQEAEIIYLGRADKQVKIRGYRIECGDVQSALEALPEIQAAAVHVLNHVQLQNQHETRSILVAHIIPNHGDPDIIAVRRQLQQLLPAVMIPEYIVPVSAFPLNQNGKVDFKALPMPTSVQSQGAQGKSLNSSGSEAVQSKRIEAQIAQIFGDLLHRDPAELDPQQNFFDLGAHSLILVEARERLELLLERKLELLELFQHPSISTLADYLDQSHSKVEVAVQEAAEPDLQCDPSADLGAIAVIGMALRLPGARSPEEYAAMLREGRSGIRFWTAAELVAAGVPESEYTDPDYVPASGWCEGSSDFAAEFFNIAPSEAYILDPQQRLMLELAYEALEHAGYPQKPGSGEALQAAVFASTGISRHLIRQIAEGTASETAWSPMQWLIANDKDYLAARVAYKLNLTGPAMMVQSACSSSLLAVHQACESLRRGEAQMALAGGVNLDLSARGYLYQEGGIYSRDGYCRPFSAQASGIVGGSGGAWLVLKPLAAAIRDGDTIYASIEASAVNNDGAQKVGFLAPGINGQQAVVEKALTLAKIKPQQIAHLEAHGTGTRVGDPIEIQSLKQAWKQISQEESEQNFCALGSVKANIGHLDAASGVASLLKVVLMLHEQVIYPTLYAEPLNPALKLDDSPFYPARKVAWPQSRPYAAVSSLGVGGTNVHMILKGQNCTAETQTADAQTRQVLAELIVLSAPDPESLQTYGYKLADFARKQSGSALGIAELAQRLRKHPVYACKRAVVARSLNALAEDLDQAGQSADVKPGLLNKSGSAQVWLCPGLGSQQIGMLEMLQCPAYREAINVFAGLLQDLSQNPNLNSETSFSEFKHLLQLLISEPKPSDLPAELESPLIMQPLIFMHGWALAQAYLALGLKPKALMGHSFGEYLAACLAGACDLAEMFALVLERARIFAALPSGVVLSVLMSAEDLRAFLSQHKLEFPSLNQLEVAVINSEQRVSVAGPKAAVGDLILCLQAAGLEQKQRILPIQHVVHHSSLAQAAQALNRAAAKVNWRKPALPVWSCLYQDWHQDIPGPEYWGQQMLEPLDFRPAIEAIGDFSMRLELGFKPQLAGLLRQRGLSVIAVRDQPWLGFLKTVGQIWVAGSPILWSQLQPSERNPQRQLLSLPAMPLPRQSFQANFAAQSPANNVLRLRRQAYLDWFSAPGWTSLTGWPVPLPADTIKALPLQELSLSSTHQPLEADDAFLVLPTPTDFEALTHLLSELSHLLHILQTTHWKGTLVLFSAAVFPLGSEELRPLLAPLQGLIAAAQLEMAFKLYWLDGAESEIDDAENAPEDLIRAFLKRVAADEPERSSNHNPTRIYSLRLGRLWQRNWQRLAPTLPPKTVFKKGGLYLILGAGGGLGSVFARYLQQHYAARLILFGRSEAPDWVESDQVVESNQVVQSNKSGTMVWVQGDLSQPEDWLRLQAIITAQAQSAPENRLHGVFHCAGLEQGGFLSQLSQEDWQHCLAAKIQGSLHLQRLLATLSATMLPPDFVLLSSALSSRLPAPAQAAYAAANAFLDALASSAGRPWIAINWPTWKETGMAQRLLAHLPKPLQPLFQHFLEQGLDNQEGCKALETALALAAASGLTQISISPLPIAALTQLLTQFQLSAGSQLPALPSQPSQPAQSGERSMMTPGTAFSKAAWQEHLAQIWQEVLGQDCTVNQRFSELGGDSLMVLQVREAIHRISGGIPPLDLLLLDASLEVLADKLSLWQQDLLKPAESLSHLLVPLNRRATQPVSEASPLFFVHAISGTVFPFRHLADGYQGPFFGLQSQGLGQAAPQNTIPEMAATYLAAIRAYLLTQSDFQGAIRLGGWSFGALVAFEMAQQAQHSDLQVADLILLDMQAPDSLEGLSTDETEIRARFEADVAALDQQMMPNSGLKEQLYAIFQAHIEASRQFRASKLELPTTLLVAEQGFSQERSEPDLGWSEYLPVLTVHKIPGDHYSCLELAQVQKWVGFTALT